MRLRCKQSENGMHSEDVNSWLYFQCRCGEKCMMLLELLILVSVGHDFVLNGSVGNACGEEYLREDVIVRRRIYLHQKL